MKGHIKFFSGILLVFIFLSGCELSQIWSQKEEYSGETVDPVAEKEVIIDSYIVQRTKDIPSISDEDMRMTLWAIEEDGVFDDISGPPLLEGKEYEEKITLVGDFVDQMMSDVNRLEVTEDLNNLNDAEVPVVDLATGVKKNFHGNDGPERYQKYLKERFNVGVYPTPVDMEGEWHGRIVTPKVVVFKEIANDLNHDPNVYYRLRERTFDFDFTITMNDQEESEVSTEDINEDVEDDLEGYDASKEMVVQVNGTITPASAADAQKFPFAYDFIPNYSQKISSIAIHYDDIKENGKLIADFGDDQEIVQGSLDLHAKYSDGKITLEGRFAADYFDKYAATSGSFTATKK